MSKAQAAARAVPTVTKVRKKRVQLVIGEPAYALLEKMKSEIAAGSFSEVIKAALSFYAWVRERRSEGYSLVLIKGEERIPVDSLLP